MFLMAFGGFALMHSSAMAEVLITEQEAALPVAPSTNLTFRGVTRAPKIKMISPAQDSGVVKSPVNLKVEFECFGGAKIDPTSVKVTYLKSPMIDLTQRLKTHLGPDGIVVETAEAPPGNHPLKVEVKDTEGRLAIANFTLNIAK